MQLTTVLFVEPEPYDAVRPKELKKELLKEDKRFRTNNEPESIGKIMKKNRKNIRFRVIKANSQEFAPKSGKKHRK